MDWKHRNPGNKTVKDVVLSLSGLTEEELLNPKPVDAASIQNMQLVANALREAAKKGTNINIMGDYDADGITSSAILYFTLKRLGLEPKVRLPKRMSEGYGLKTETISEFSDGILITVDNGISANEAIQAAKDKDLTVIVMDHHLPGEELPCADIIVDPHISPEENGFDDYCGAGLAYKLAQMLFPNDETFLSCMECLATIGTIADSMPLVSDNRYIVKRGLDTMQANKNLLPGLKALIEVAEIYKLDEYAIGFKLGPMLNAAGRMRDDGAQIAFETLISKERGDAGAHAETLKTLNEQRKDVTNSMANYIDEIIQEQCLYYDSPICVYAEDIPEGIVGILTGRIAEQYKVPAFILTDSETPGVLKGSGRSYGSINLMEVVEAARPFLVAGGGHAGAAGISVRKEDYAAMVNAMCNAMASYTAPAEDVLEYDLAIEPDAVSSAYAEIKKYAPYGQGNPRPVFLVNDIVLSPRNGSVAKYMGKNAEHVKLYSRAFSAICFGRSESYREMGCPVNIDIVGELSMNVFRYSSELQIEVTDFREHKKTAGKVSTLMEALRRNGTI